MAEVLGGRDLDVVELLAEWRGPGLEVPAEKALLRAGLVLKAARAIEVLDALLDGFVEADHHCGCSPQSGGDDGGLRREELRHGVLELAVAEAEVLGEYLRAASGDPADAGLFQALGCGRVGERGVVGEVEELRDGEGVELDAVAVAGADGANQIAVVVERELRVEASVEAGQVAAEGEQFVDLGEDLLLAEDVSARLAGKRVEGAVVALRHADIRRVDDPHQQIGACVGRVEARAHQRGERAHLFVRHLAPEQEGICGRDALAALDLAADCGERRGGCAHRAILLGFRSVEVLERFHRNCYRARIIKVVFLEEKPRKRSSLL